MTIVHACLNSMPTKSPDTEDTILRLLPGILNLDAIIIVRHAQLQIFSHGQGPVPEHTVKILVTPRLT